MSTPDKDIRFAVTAEDRFSRTFASLRRDLAGSQDQMGGIVAKAGAVNLALGSITLGAAGAGGLLLGVRQLAHDLDALNDAADATGSSVETLSALEDVARRNGQSLDTVVSAALKLNKVLNEATPDSPMAVTLKRIGLDAAELRNMDPGEAVQKLAKALAGFADDGKKAQLILALTGKSTKELAPFLKDLAEAGSLNAKVTTEQAQQAEKFNKELFGLQTNASNAARSLVSDLLPSINTLFDRVKTARSTYGSLGAFILGNIGDIGKTDSQRLDGARADVEQYTATIEKLNALQIRQRGMLSPYDQGIRERAQASLADAKRLLEYQKEVQRQNVLASAGAIADDPRLRSQARPSVGAQASAPAAAPKVSEAMRYLETLQKQGEKLQDLTVYQQLLKDIEAKRIDGITPKLERELKIAAQRIDLQKKLNDEKEREAGFQKLISDKAQRDVDEVQRLLEQTPTGRLQGIEGQSDRLLEFSRRIGEDDPRQRQVIEAMQRLKKEAQDIASPAKDAASEFDKLADSIDKSMDRATGALLDFVLDGKGGVADLGRAFGRDVLRSLIEDPMRDAMKEVSKTIRKALSNDGGGWEGLLKLFGSGSSSGGSGGGWGDIFQAVGSFFGFTGRAGGGSVNAGDLVRWQENGREWFVPGTDGTVVNQAQMRAMGGGGVTQYHTWNIQAGGDPREVQRQIDAALARNNRALARSMRYGGTAAA